MEIAWKKLIAGHYIGQKYENGTDLRFHKRGSSFRQAASAIIEKLPSWDHNVRDSPLASPEGYAWFGFFGPGFKKTVLARADTLADAKKAMEACIYENSQI